MKQAFWIIWLAAQVVLLHASQLEPKDRVDEYPHACRFDAGAIGVDYLRRSLPTPQGIQLIPGTLIFEIAVYPEAGRTLHFDLSSFELDWKKAERAQGPLSPQYVVASLMRPEFSGSDRGLIVGAGRVDRRTGDFEGIEIGGPPRNRRFPGDPRQNRPAPQSGPANPRLPKSEPHPDDLPSAIIPLHALPSEPIDHPSAGYIYFAYNGKLTKLRRLTLKIRQGEQSCELLMRK